MKTSIYIITIFILTCVVIKAQDVENKLNEAKSAYKSEKYEDSRFALQQALSEVDIIVGKEVLAILPDKMNSLECNKENDQVTGSAAGFAGLYVYRVYGGGEGQNDANISIIGDSPLLSGINAILSLPAIAMSDPNQKRIKVDGYKALLQRIESSEGTVSYDVQIPYGNSLITFHCEGFSKEGDVTAMANTIPVSKIAGLTK